MNPDKWTRDVRDLIEFIDADHESGSTFKEIIDHVAYIFTEPKKSIFKRAMKWLSAVRFRSPLYINHSAT